MIPQHGRSPSGKTRSTTLMTAALAAAPVLTLATMEAIAAVGPVTVGTLGLMGTAGLVGARTVRRTRPSSPARHAARTARAAARRAHGGRGGIAQASRRRTGATLASGSVGVGGRRAARAIAGSAQSRTVAGRSRNPLNTGRGRTTSPTATGRTGTRRGRVAGLLSGQRRPQGTTSRATSAAATRKTTAQTARQARRQARRRLWNRATRWHRAWRARRHVAGSRARQALYRGALLVSGLLTYLAAAIRVGTVAWVRCAHRVGNHVRAFRLASLAFLAIPFEGLGPDLRRLLALLRDALTPAELAEPTVIPAVPEHEIGDPAMSDLSGVTTNLRPLIDAIRESGPLGGGEAPHAIAVAKWHDDLAELMDALADRVRADAQIAAETLPAESGAHEITATLGDSASAFAGEIEEASAAWRAVNGTRWERLTSEDDRERQWDHSTRPDA